MRKEERQGRLTPVTRERLYPLRRADQMTGCALYWLPTSAFPIPDSERAWSMRFLDELALFATQRLGLRSEVFLQLKTIADGDLKTTFHRHQTNLIPIMGLSRRPGRGLPPIPTEEDLEPILKGKKKFEFDEYIGDYCFWFLNKQERRQRELFFGSGGMTIIFLKPDPKAAPPKLPFSAAHRESPLFKQFDIDGLLTCAFALSDDFMQKSKDIFGKGLEDDPQFPGLTYIVPLLGTHDFFTNTDNLTSWFQLLDIYVNESPADQGIVLASKHDLDDDLALIIDKMRQDGAPF